MPTPGKTPLPPRTSGTFSGADFRNAGRPPLQGLGWLGKSLAQSPAKSPTQQKMPLPVATPEGLAMPPV